jgi:hypothetical protein
VLVVELDRQHLFEPGVDGGSQLLPVVRRCVFTQTDMACALTDARLAEGERPALVTAGLLRLNCSD